MQIIQPPVGSRGSSASDDPNSALAVSNKAALECLLTAQIHHPNIVATYKSAQVPYKVQDSTSLSLLCILLCTVYVSSKACRSLFPSRWQAMLCESHTGQTHCLQQLMWTSVEPFGRHCSLPLVTAFDARNTALQDFVVLSRAMAMPSHMRDSSDWRCCTSRRQRVLVSVMCGLTGQQVPLCPHALLTASCRCCRSGIAWVGTAPPCSSRG